MHALMHLHNHRQHRPNDRGANNRRPTASQWQATCCSYAPRAHRSRDEWIGDGGVGGEGFHGGRGCDGPTDAPNSPRPTRRPKPNWPCANVNTVPPRSEAGTRMSWPWIPTCCRCTCGGVAWPPTCSLCAC